MLITTFLQNTVQTHKDEEAIVFIDRDSEGNRRKESLTWNELNTISNQIANMMIEKGIAQGDKVAILLSNCLEWLPIYFAILKTGAVAVPINYNNSAEEICYCIEFADCVGVFLKYDDQSLDSIMGTLGETVSWFFVGENISSVGQDFWSSIKRYPDYDPKVQIHPHDDAAIYFSSGTTGKSKGVLLSHKALAYGAITEISHHHQQSNDKFLCLAPLYHTGAKIHWFGSLLVGGSIIIDNSFSPKKVAETIEQEKISIVWLVVPKMQDILDAVNYGDISLKQFSSLRLVHSGAQPIPADLVRRWKKMFPNVLYDISYGLTEATGPGCLDLGMGLDNKEGATGKPAKNWNAMIVDEKGKEVEIGIVGELVLKGPGLMTKYYKDDIATSNTIIDGWLYTGDMAYKDLDNYFYIVGRKKDVVICGGENIYPAQIENFLRKFDIIKDVAVFGIPNKRLGECVTAVIELKDGVVCDKKYIHNLCKALPEYQRPLRILFAPVIRNSTGKIDKKALKEMYIKSR